MGILLVCSVDPQLPALLNRSQFVLIPVYDACCVLTGAAVVEVLASPIKVPPVRQNRWRINTEGKAMGDPHSMNSVRDLSPHRSVFMMPARYVKIQGR